MKLLFLYSLNAAIGLAASSAAFVAGPSSPLGLGRVSRKALRSPSSSSALRAEEGGSAAVAASPSIDTKEAIKLFGRLAEEYIMIDPTGGRCCYAGCHDCAYRLPDGSYQLKEAFADGKPKWIPSYVVRFFGTSDMEKEHTTKWSSLLFSDMRLALSKEDFVKYLLEMPYSRPDGPPADLLAVGGLRPSEAAAEALWDVIAQDKKRLTRHKMGKRIKELAGGEDFMMWSDFEAALVGKN